MIGIIYKYTSPSNKSYIGQTINEYYRRLTFLNVKIEYAGIKINNARKKYGPENFKYEVLEKYEYDNAYELLNKLDEREIYNIQKYNSFNNGYNGTKGGQFSILMTDEIKQKISKSKQKKVIQYDLQGYFIKIWNNLKEISDNYKVASSGIAQCCRGESTYSAGYIWKYYTEDYPVKIDGLSEKRINSILRFKESVYNKDGKSLKKLLQYDLNGDFIKIVNSMTEAMEICGIKSNSSISNCCSGKSKQSGGYIWRFYSEDYPNHIDVDLSIHSLCNTNRKQIYQYDLEWNLIKIWNSQQEAANECGIGRQGIYQCCTGQLKTYKKYRWSYVEYNKQTSISNS